MDSIVQAPYDAAVRLTLASLERNLLPDAVIRRITRLLLAGRLRAGYKPTAELQLSDLLQFANSLREMPIAILTEDAKSQHYELPTSFFKLVLGKHLKYSCCLFSGKSITLENAEKAMLELYCERAQLQDGHTVLDVGCGWGSLSLHTARKYSNCKIKGICNSVTQKAYIEEQCRKICPVTYLNLPRAFLTQISDIISRQQINYEPEHGHGVDPWQSVKIVHYSVCIPHCIDKYCKICILVLFTPGNL